MTVNDMRRILMDRYSSTIRKQRVDRMPDSQVVAIYRSLVERKDLPSKNSRLPKKRRLHEPEQYEQLRMEFMNDQAS